MFLFFLSSFGQKNILPPFDSASQIGTSISINALSYSNAINKYYFNESTFDQLALYLLENKDVYVEISCFSDFSDFPLMNLMATKEQSNDIRDFLVRKGVDGSRIKTIGNGDMFPIYEDFEIEKMSELEKEEANLANRRIEITIIKKG